jgi:hypothetical protein
VPHVARWFNAHLQSYPLSDFHLKNLIIKLARAESEAVDSARANLYFTNIYSICSRFYRNEIIFKLSVSAQILHSARHEIVVAVSCHDLPERFPARRRAER